MTIEHITPATHNPEIQQQLSIVAQRWEALQAAVTALESAEVNSAPYLTELDKIRSLNIATLENMNQAVGMLAMSIARPLSEFSEAVISVEQTGDFSIRSGVTSRDEIGQGDFVKRRSTSTPQWTSSAPRLEIRCGSSARWPRAGPWWPPSISPATLRD